MNNDRINFYGTTGRTESSARLNQEQIYIYIYIYIYILSQGSVSVSLLHEEFENYGCIFCFIS